MPEFPEIVTYGELKGSEGQSCREWKAAALYLPLPPITKNQEIPVMSPVQSLAAMPLVFAYACQDCFSTLGFLAGRCVQTG